MQYAHDSTFKKNLHLSSPKASPFSFIALNLVEKAVLQICLIMVDYVKNALQNRQQISSNAEHFQGK